ncbi:MAG: hypothetical protein NVS2B8_19220 [Vulcanimicrobiaceae bacterium]
MPSPQSNALRLYNTRTRNVERFVPLEDDHVRIYVCGLTPSAEAHLGHARSFMFFDVLRRYLVHLGYRVTYVRNVTDIDDRSIAEARATGKPWSDVVGGYFASFTRSMARLHLLEPDHEPRATAYVPEIVDMIGRLVERDNAYAAPDGVYFSVSSFPRYGALSGRNTDELLIGARIAADEGKRDPLDFALWKFAKPGEPSWESPWGAGRPGWHIECSAMSHALLGEPFDIHGGGYDLIFPHHENEVAQTESLVPPPMASVWVHGGLLQFDGKKMSKSLGNFEPLYALLDRHDPQAIRLLFLQSGYRKPMNFTEAAIEGATTGLRRLLAAYDALRTAPPTRVAAAGLATTTSSEATPVSAASSVGETSRRSTTTHSTRVATHDAHDAHDVRRGGTHGASPSRRSWEDARHATESVATARSYARRFEAALDDDMNTAGALSVLFDVAGAASDLVRDGHASAIAAFMHEAMTIVGIAPNERAEAPAKAVLVEKTVQLATATAIASDSLATIAYTIVRAESAVPSPQAIETMRVAVAGDARLRVLFDARGAIDIVDAFVAERASAKARRDFATADLIRTTLESVGISLADAKGRTTWRIGA